MKNKEDITAYIQSLRNMYPENLPKGSELVKKGLEIGTTFEAGYNRFCLENGYDKHIE